MRTSAAILKPPSMGYLHMRSGHRVNMRILSRTGPRLPESLPPLNGIRIGTARRQSATRVHHPPQPSTFPHDPTAPPYLPQPSAALRSSSTLFRHPSRDVLERSHTVGGGGKVPPPPGPPPPPLPMFEADSQNFASAPSVPRGFELTNFWPAFGGEHRGTLGGGGVPVNPPPPSDPPPPYGYIPAPHPHPSTFFRKSSGLPPQRHTCCRSLDRPRPRRRRVSHTPCLSVAPRD